MADKKNEIISILRRNKVEVRTGLKRSTIYHLISQGIFPSPIKLGPRSGGRVESEVEYWLAERVACRDKGLKATEA